MPAADTAAVETNEADKAPLPATEPSEKPSSFQASADKTEAKVKALNAGLKADAALKPNPVLHKLIQGDFQRAEVARPDYRVIIKNNAITLDDVLNPAFWANVGNQLKEAIKRYPFPVVELIWDDASRYVRLLVIDADNLWAKVKVIEDVDLSGALKEAENLRQEATLNSDYLVKRISPSIGWAVIRASDNKRIKTNLGSKPEAETWLTNHLKSLAN